MTADEQRYYELGEEFAAANVAYNKAKEAGESPALAEARSEFYRLREEMDAQYAVITTKLKARLEAADKKKRGQ